MAPSLRIMERDRLLVEEAGLRKKKKKRVLISELREKMIMKDGVKK